jgi:hypothetical protein
MNRHDINELHYITPIANVPSILKHGLLSHSRAQNVVHHSVAMAEIQQRRSGKVVPGGRPLHDYVNLYFHARNPMLYKRKTQRQELCVLRISPEVLDLSGAIICDGNAASNYTRFWLSPDGLQFLCRDDVFAERWTDPSPITKWEKARKRCSEVLVPDQIEVRCIIGAYVSCPVAQGALAETGFQLPITVDAHLFFCKITEAI